MSIRRKVGDWVWMPKNTGFIIESDRFKAQIQADGGSMWCLDECGDEDCFEWATLLTEPDDTGYRRMLCHVNECRMFDEPAEDKKVLCSASSKCQNLAAPLHTCPFKEEIKNDSTTLCDCCSSCRQECLWDI